MAGLKTPEAFRLRSGGAPKARVCLPSATRPIPLVPVAGFEPIPAGEESETTTTSLEIGRYATLLTDDDDDDDLRATISDGSSSGLHPLRISEVPVEVDIEIDFDAEDELFVEEEGRPDPCADSAIYFKDETETKRRPAVTPADLYGALETVPLSSAVVRFAIESVDARAATRAETSAAPPRAPMPLAAPVAAPPSSTVRTPARGTIAIEIAIGLVTFVAAAAPAFWYLFLR